MSFDTFNGISASIHGPDDVWYDMTPPANRYRYSAKICSGQRPAARQRLKRHPRGPFMITSDATTIVRTDGALPSWEALDPARRRQAEVRRLPAGGQGALSDSMPREAKQLEAADLKDILAGHAPAEIKLEYGVFRAPRRLDGRQPVRAIAEASRGMVTALRTEATAATTAMYGSSPPCTTAADGWRTANREAADPA